MNILMIGNGFDLAHGLPTKYTDFLDFCRMIKVVYQVEVIQDAEDIWDELCVKSGHENDALRMLFMELYSIRAINEAEIEDGIIWEYVVTNTKYDEFETDINDNIWIEYFLQNPMYQKENWIDFESEISKIIQVFDMARVLTEKGKSVIDIEDKSFADIANAVLKAAKKRVEDIFRSTKQIDDFVGILENDLKRLIRALEIYLAEFVGKVEITNRSQDIGRTTFDYILNFNYTDTYQRVYGEGKAIKYDYIHGEIDINHTVETNNMVLGIDEYLSEDRRNKDTNFIAFKKFYQRIHKETGCQYKEWIEEIVDIGKTTIRSLEQEYPVQIPFSRFPYKNYLHIFGHSLDVTDGDILRDFILNDNIYTTIYYLNKKVMGQQIANLVKVIGQDELIRRTGGKTRTIEFKKQQDMIKW